MKRYFGSLLLRVVRSGVVLRKNEHQIVASMVAELPDHLRGTVESQFNEYNLVQREADGRTLNFYKMGFMSAKPRQPQNALHGTKAAAPLMRVSVSTPGDTEPLHATLNAVNGRVFCVSFSKVVPESNLGQAISITKVTHAWHSNFPTR